MKKLTCIAAMLTGLASAPVAAQTFADVNFEHTDFSDDFGQRQVGEVTWSSRWNATTAVIQLAQGSRDYGDEDFSASRFQGSLYHDWSDRFYTRTSAAVATNSPVFALHDITQEVNFKAAPGVVATGALRHLRYYGDRDALAWSAGGTVYFRGGFANYRYSSFDVDDLGRTHGHLASVRINDARGPGQTQLWLGAGTSLHEYDVLPTLSEGKLRAIALRRLQPISAQVALDLTVGRTWYDTGETDYRGTSARIGLRLTR